MAYTTATQVRAISGHTTSEISDSDIETLIGYATIQINRDMQVKIVREPIEHIDNTRENKIDGSNTTYYIRNWKDYYIGDGDDDGDVDTSDITVYQVISDGTESTLTVSTITPDDGKFVLSSAPSGGVDLYVTYHYSPVSMYTPHSMIKLATAYLTASLIFLRIDVKKTQQFATGKLRVSRQSEGYTIFYDKYKEILNELRNMPIKQEFSDALTKRVKPGFVL